jgi:LysR substrate binding domain
MIQEGCDAGLMLGTITDENVVARPAGKVARCIVASPALVKSRPALKGPSDLKSWPWLTLSSNQFGGSKVVTLFNHKRSRQELRLSPLLISEGVSSLREAALGGWAWLLLVSGWYGMISGQDGWCECCLRGMSKIYRCISSTLRNACYRPGYVALSTSP